MNSNAILKISMILLIIFPRFLVAQSAKPYAFEKSVAIGGDFKWDYLSVDSVHRRLYVSHQTKVVILDMDRDTVVGEIDNLHGVHGIAIAQPEGKGFISNGQTSTITIFDLATFKVLATLATAGKGPDGIIYDPYSHGVFAFNGDSNNATVIDAVGSKIKGYISLPGGPEFSVSDGSGHVFVNLEDQNAISDIDVNQMKVVATWPLSPGTTPTGLDMDRVNKRLFSGCRGNKAMEVMDAATGKVIQTLPIGSSVDAVVYQPSTHLIFCSNGEGNVTIIHQTTSDTYQVVQNLETMKGSKTMALDVKTGKIYLSAAKFVGNSKRLEPGSFQMLIYKN